ncbi:MAG: GntR family transcriptional regulator [Planctomycetaceae bacterium]|nr:GntR family transcriptional regulator [Planctomycetaceae bacterium]
MELAINPTTGVPIYLQLAEQIRAGIARGKLRPDQRLLSVRELSQQLVVNPNTIARAYTELEREGVLYTRPGLGVFVARSAPALPKKIRRERLLGGLDRLLVEAVGLGFSADELMELVHERVKQYQWIDSARAS